MRENCFWISTQSAVLPLFEGGSEMRDVKEPCNAARHFLHRTLLMYFHTQASAIILNMCSVFKVIE